MGYKVELISPEEKDRIFEELKDKLLYERKAHLHGICIKLYTNSKRIKDMWEDNFYFMSEFIKSHGRVIAYYTFKEGDTERVLYDPYTNTAFLFNLGYYGYVKSIALGVAGDVLEDEHGIYSIHGACLDVDGRGVSIIAPSGTGKTTHAFGLLQMKGVKLISDDWHFVRNFGDEFVAYTSEKNCYIRDDLSRIWPEYHYLVEKVDLDKEGRGVADIRWLLGKAHVRESTVLKSVILLKRDPEDKEIIRKLTPGEGVDYLKQHSFCNPHLLVTDERKTGLRVNFFKNLFSTTDVWLVNTVLPPAETQERIRKLVKNGGLSVPT
ncbi:MAG: aldolase [Thermoplasmata archaeon]